jgi:hypothetical protein
MKACHQRKRNKCWFISSKNMLFRPAWPARPGFSQTPSWPNPNILTRIRLAMISILAHRSLYIPTYVFLLLLYFLPSTQLAIRNQLRSGPLPGAGTDWIKWMTAQNRPKYIGPFPSTGIQPTLPASSQNHPRSGQMQILNTFYTNKLYPSTKKKHFVSVETPGDHVSVHGPCPPRESIQDNGTRTSLLAKPSPN